MHTSELKISTKLVNKICAKVVDIGAISLRKLNYSILNYTHFKIIMYTATTGIRPNRKCNLISLTEFINALFHHLR